MRQKSFKTTLYFELLPPEEIAVVLRNLDEKKGSGCDDLPTFAIKRLANVLAVPLRNVFNASL